MRKETESYLQGTNLASPPSPADIQTNLLHRIEDECNKVNMSLRTGEKKLSPPECLDPVQIAEIMSKLYNIRRISASEESSNDGNNLLAVYQDSGERAGTYDDNDEVLRALAKQFKYRLYKRDFDEVVLHLKNLVPKTSRTIDPDLIAVNNGIFNYRTKRLLPFSPDYVFTCKSHVNYVDHPINPVIHNDDGTDWDVESWMFEVMGNDPDMTQLMWEILGAIVRPHVRWNKAAWLYSMTGNNGKGTLCELMRNLVGRGAYASISIADFSKDFMLEPLVRAQAIIVDENDVGQFIDKAANLKAVTTNDVVLLNRKFKEPIAYQFFGFMVQCLNEMPRAKDRSDSFYRRQLFVPFTKCFTGKERKYIKEDYLRRKEVLEYVLWKVLNMNYYTLSEPAACRSVLDEYKEYNDPIRQFVDEMLPQCKWDLLPFTFLYDLYKSWYKKISPEGKPVNNKAFINELLTVLKSNPSSAWICPDKTKVMRSGNMMNEPEPLILKYDLSDWRNPTYRGSDPNMICRTVLGGSYRGLRRVVTNTPPQNAAPCTPPGPGNAGTTGN